MKCWEEMNDSNIYEKDVYCSIPRCVVCKELELMRLFESESTGKKAVCGHGESAWEEQECPRAGRGKREDGTRG